MQSPFVISVCPRITAEGERLVASTSWLARLFFLGFSFKTMVVNRETQTITIERRMAWLFRRKDIISFPQVEAVTYGYEDSNPLAGLSDAYDPIDRFVVGLKVRRGEDVRLFSFIGDGVFTNEGPLPDWWYWEEFATDFSGTQERESRLFMQLLSKLLGVTVVPSTLTEE